MIIINKKVIKKENESKEKKLRHRPSTHRRERAKSHLLLTCTDTSAIASFFFQDVETGVSKGHALRGAKTLCGVEGNLREA